MGVKFDLLAKRGSFIYQFTGDAPEGKETDAVDMLTAMQEGLWANGFECDASLIYSTRTSL